MARKAQPEYVHDCPDCTYLGPFIDQDNGHNLDLFFCAGPPISLIARFASEGSSYRAGLCFGVIAAHEGRNEHPLAEAYNRACALGLLSPDLPEVQKELWTHFGAKAVRPALSIVPQSELPVTGDRSTQDNFRKLISKSNKQ